MLSFALVFAVPSFVLAAVNNSHYGGWKSPRGGVVRDTFFLEGGLMSSQNGDINNHPYGVFYELRFCSAFDINTDSFDEILNPLNETLNGDAAVMVDGYLFADNDEFYTYGGMAYPEAQGSAPSIFHAGLNQPNPDASLWVPSLDTNFLLEGVTGYITNGAGVSVPSESLGFYFGGLRSASGGNLSFVSFDVGRPDTLSETFIQVDMSTYESPKWSSLDWPSNIASRADASLVWIPVSNKGLLIAIGGLVNPSDIYSYALNDTQTAESVLKSPGFMTQLPVYDIAGQTWYLQNTSGTSPGQLGQFCTVVTSAADDNSYQIYVYGGWDGLGEKQASDEVWVLSVPSFKWIKVSDGTANHRRRSHVCASPAPNQMITVGGVNEVDFVLESALIDVFDLNTLTWTGKYDPKSDTEYKTPSKIENVIKNPDGSIIFADDMDSKLAALFKTPYSKQIVPNYPYDSCGGQSNHSSTPSWRYPVIGAVVGVVVLALIITAVWCCYRRRNKSMRRRSMTESAYSQGFISRWIHGTQYSSPAPAKTYFSETTTEVGEPLSPAPVAHEADGYFKPRAELPNSPASPQAVTSPFSPFGFRSPRTPQSESAEVADTARYELPGHDASSIRNHPMYPPSISGNPLSSGGNTISTPSERPGTSRSVTNSSRPGPVSPYELAHNRSDEAIRPAPDSDFKLDDQNFETPISPGPIVSPLAPGVGNPYQPTAVSPVMTPPSRPIHHRNTSSLSSGMAQLPSPSSEEDYRRSQAIASLSSVNSSPEIQQGRFTHTPLDQHMEEDLEHKMSPALSQSEYGEESEEGRARREWSNF